MHIAIVSDAWHPQVNGVVRTLDTLTRGLVERGRRVTTVTPDRFATVPCPTYPEIRLALAPGRRVAALLDEAAPSAIHISTEGPLGLAARRYCLARGYPFTTAFHTRFPEYVKARIGLPLGAGYGILRWFHGRARTMMVATPTVESELLSRGFTNVKRWSRGVDLARFHPRPKDFLPDPRPISLYAGRVAIEKNLEAFLSLPLPGTKYVVGDGPQLAELRRKYPDVRFAGMRHGEELARYIAAADVFVFPSRTDTFGLVMLEALASGVPVAAFPVAGPLDVIDRSGAGALDDDLGRAVKSALDIPPERCRAYAQEFTWENSIRQFESNLAPFR
jgi:glycosyltransferase involved in cell wall biosynthesis